MVMHGGTQLIANMTRAILLRRNVYWRGFALYVVGALASFCIMRGLAFVPEPLLVFFGLGLTPSVAALLRPRCLDFEGPGAVTCGALVAAVQLLAGAAGPLRCGLRRHEPDAPPGRRHPRRPHRCSPIRSS